MYLFSDEKLKNSCNKQINLPAWVFPEFQGKLCEGHHALLESTNEDKLSMNMVDAISQVSGKW